MALAQIGEIERRQLVKRSAALGRKLLAGLSALSDERSTLNARPSRLSASARGLGLMAGLELRHCDGSPATALALDAIKAMLDRGFILLSEGADSNVISFTPPLNISERQLASASSALREVLAWLDSRL
jgi:4-aminobutyrate aminotransferase-like enzyme